MVRGLPEAASGQAFAAPLGLLAWAAGEGRPLLDLQPGLDRPNGAFRRLVNWLRDRA
jgi:cell division protein FtsA